MRSVRHVVSFAILAGTALAQAPLFPVSYWYQAGNAPTGSTLADLNGDGHLDYLVANYFASDVSIYLNTGNGFMNALPLLPVGGQPRSLTVADVNNDTKPDLITVNSTSDNVSVLLGNGAGGFGAPVTFPAGSFPTSIDAGDLDNDGDIDLVVGEQSTGEWSALLGNGAGSFAAPISTTIGASSDRIQLADMNLDGKLDCIGGNWLDDSVTVGLGNGAGSFNVSASPFTTAPKGLDVGDVSGDGKPDVVVCSSQHDVMTVFLGTGTGGLLPGKTYWLQSGVTYPTAVMIADANADGRPDLIAAAASSKTLTVFNNIGAGNFAFQLTTPIAEQPYEAVAADLNGDGFADVVTAHQTEDSIRVHISQGVGAWERYCNAKINSLGCTPKIQATGTPSVSNQGTFYVLVTDVLNNKAGLFLYTVNGSQASIPFQGGTLCIGPSGIKRTPAKDSGNNPKYPPPNCTGAYGLDFNKFAQGLAGGNPHPGLLVLGNTYQVQCWSRDNGFPAPNNTGLSPAIDVTPWL